MHTLILGLTTLAKVTFIEQGRSFSCTIFQLNNQSHPNRGNTNTEASDHFPIKPDIHQGKQIATIIKVLVGDIFRGHC
jgi:hypothetical protein